MSSSRSALVVFCLALCAPVFAQCNSNDTTAPCFANVPDILGGRQSVIQDDDLVVNGVFVDPAISFFYPVADGRIGYTTNSQISSKGHTFTGPVANVTTNVVSVKGRMFNLKNDQVVSIVGAGAPAQQSANIAGLPGGVVPALGLFNGPTQTLYGAAGRFVGNGFDQMVFAAAQFNSPLKQVVLQAIGAANPSQPTSGISVGTATAPINNASPVYAMTSGIFTDPQSGQAPPNAQIAFLSSNPSNGTGLTLSLYSVTSNLSIVAGPTLNLNLGSDGSATLGAIAIASGRLTGGNHDQLVVAYAAPNPANPGAEPVKLVTIDFSPTGTPIQQTTFLTNATVNAANPVASPSVLLRAGRFKWFGDSSQVALSTYSYLGGPGNYVGTGQMQIVSFDPSLNATSGPVISTSGLRYHYALAAGRFDRMQTNPNPPPPTDINPNLQLADVQVYVAGEASQIIELNVYDVDPSTFAITLNESWEFFPYAYVPNTPAYGPLTFSLNAADMQGRSLAIGPPEVATVTGHIQPDLILGMPPMHVDWVPPAGGGAPQVVNISVHPTSFNAAYSFATTSTTNGSRSGTTSYTAATKKTVGAKISYGYPGLGGVSVQASTAVGQLHEKVVARKFNTYSGRSTAFSTQTTFDDVVAASSSRLNLYSYRVIGQCTPSPNAPASEGCAPGTSPLYVQFSGPDSIEYVKAVEGHNAEWYQPVQEPGNLFSYPANLQQLKADLAGGTSLMALTPTDSVWDAQTSDKFYVNWTQGAGTNVSAGSTATHSFDAQVSVSASAGIFGFDIGANAGFDYNSSSSVRTLNQSTSSLEASSGVILQRGIGGHSGNNPVYDYSGQSLIYGEQAPPGTIQNDIVNSATIQAPGHLTVTHTTDMLSQNVVTSGPFWPQTYASAPDLALNHPERWSQYYNEVSEQQVWFNCPAGFASSGTSPSCTPNGQVPNPVSVTDAAFYSMKGLFVTPGSTTRGPQITSATLGSKVNLRVRIYNYSLANFPAGTVTHVQFYAQPWDSQHGQFTSLPAGSSTFAPAVFIGEGTDIAGNPLTPVPAFCGGSSSGDPCLGSTVRNWEFAYAKWDTTQGRIAPNSTWKFWVVVWAEYNGQAVGEIAGHGLKSIASSQFNSLADVPVETYSNNLGFYNQVFTLLAPASGSPKSAKSLLSVSNVHLRSGSSTLRDTPVTITATHRASGSDIRSILSLYYDGDPARKGTLFDMQSIDRVSAAGMVDTVRFTPKSCGLHRIFVRSVPQDGSAPVATAETTVEVNIDTAQAVTEVDDLIVYLQRLPGPAVVKRELRSYLASASRAFKSRRNAQAVRWLDRFHDELRKHRNDFEEKAADAMRRQAEDVLGCIPHCDDDGTPAVLASVEREN